MGESSAYFRAARMAWVQLAAQNPARGLLCHNASGTYQLYALDTDTWQARQITHAPNDTLLAAISADGQHIYYLENAQGGQIGHLFRVNYDGSDAQDLTPDWAAYTSFYVACSHSGAFYGFMTANQYGYQMFVVDARSGAQPHLRYESEAMSLGPFLSYDAELAVVAAADDTGALALESYDVRTGQRVQRLAAAAGSVQPAGFAQRPHDMRFAAVDRQGDWERPFLWNARTGERHNLQWGDTLGDIHVLDWTPDAQRLLLACHHLGRQRLLEYDLKQHTLAYVPGFSDDMVMAAHYHRGGVLALAQNLAQPPRLLLDGRAVFALDDLPARDVRFVKHYRSDGVMTSAWGALPQDAAPLLVYLPSDPREPYENTYHPALLAWQDAGWNFLAVNTRGRYGFGAAAAQSLVVGISDVQDVVIALHDEPADPSATILMGAGYGGALALLALAAHPQRFAGAIVAAPVVDWAALYEADEARQPDIARLMGGTPQQAPDAYAQASPLGRAAGIARPVLFIVADSDPQPAQTAELAAQMQQRNPDVTVEDLGAAPTPERIQAAALAWARARWGFRPPGAGAASC
jgi:pimeloyl-ACP methyl ester carboxylesterase